MRHIIIALGLICAGMGLSACSTIGNPSAFMERGAVMEAARRTSERYASTWNASDWNSFGALYAADARHVTLNGAFLRGRSVIVSAHRDNRANYSADVRMVTRLEGARAVTDDTVVAVMIVEYVNDPSAPNRIQAARLTLTLVRRQGAWVIAQAQASAAAG